MKGVKEDVINIILNLKRVRFKVVNDEEQIVTLKVKGVKDITAGDIKVPGQVEVLNPDQHVASITDKATELSIEIKIKKVKNKNNKPNQENKENKIGAVPATPEDASLAALFRVGLVRPGYDVSH